MIWKAAWAIDHPDAAAEGAAGLPLHVIARVYTAEAAHEVTLLAAECFGDDHGGIIGGFRDQSLDGVFDADGLSRPQTELCRILLRSVLRYMHLGVEADLAGIEALEQQVERHHLGQ